jgi:phosphoglycolate phosphatase
MDLTDKPVFIFDFDGTLVQSDAIKRETFFTTVADRPDATAALREILSAPDTGDRYDVFRKLADRIEGVDVDARARAYAKTCEDKISRAPEVAGATAVLECISANGTAAYINSATPEPALMAIIERMPFAAFIRGAFGGPRSKIDNGRDILLAEKCAPSDCVVVGNDESDRQCALALGCMFIGVRTAYGHFDIEPETCFDDLRPLAAALGA